MDCWLDPLTGGETREVLNPAQTCKTVPLTMSPAGVRGSTLPSVTRLACSWFPVVSDSHLTDP